ncbi:hypothetical protein [Pseudomonas phage PA1C]|uniref:Uncharacterized protein n=1 Tax=Pseudomonas phage vB_PaeM_PS119XW TaxID=2601632 RepID=A0A5C1K7S4_9CAUD|nr:hypothetical protein PP933_gp201 [Pseudomonas phage vB_PaeM_PS119XW]QBX32356.1 hypothetical protein [Pseudomonas phage PA1C]QEM41930.1 hypothetical protein [Pseudomonas phage vB_PaeM_PS119XW]
MSNIPFYWTVKTTGLTESELINTVLRLHEEVDSVNDTIIDGTLVDLDVLLEVKGQDDLVDDAIIDWIRDNYKAGDNIVLKVKTNRFVFGWFAQGIVDIGAILQKYEQVPDMPMVFDTFKLKDYNKEKPRKKGFFEQFKESINPLVELAYQNKGSIAGIALVAGSVLFAKKLQDDLVKTTEETVRKTMQEFEPPTVEIHIDEYGTFEDVIVD